MRRPGFGLWLGAIVAAGLVLRALYAYVLVGDAVLLGDALEFHLQANLLADGRGYIQPFIFESEGVVRPSADKPPLYPFLEAGVSLLGGRSPGWHHLVGIVSGGGTIAVVGLLARRLAGDGTGLLAAGLAALHPVLIATDGSLRTESTYTLLVALVLLAALRFRDTPSARRAAVLGAVIGLAALTRGEALLLLGVLVLPLAGLRRTVVAGVVCSLVLAPWLVRCAIVFDRPVPIATNVGGLLAGANCDATYAGDLLGGWDFRCLPPPVYENEALEANRQRDVGLAYARDHAGRLPVVLAARLGRTFELYRPWRQASQGAFFEGRNERVGRAGVLVFLALVPLAGLGAVVLRRRGAPWAVLVAPLLLVVFVTLTAYGYTRFRAGAEPGLIVLAAVGLGHVMARLGPGGRGRGSGPAPAGPAPGRA